MTDLETALAEAMIILEALHTSVRWELSPEVKAEIERVIPLGRAALAQFDAAAETRGSWPNGIHRAFVEGAGWGRFAATGFTMFSSERREAEEEAVKRYGPVDTAEPGGDGKGE